MQTQPNETTKFTINKNEYTCVGLGAVDQIHLLTRICNIAGIPVAAIIDVAFGTVTDDNGEKLDVDLQKAARGLVAGIGDGTRNLDTILLILRSTKVGGNTLSLGDQNAFDMHFNRKMSELSQVLGEVLKYQFADFFEPGGIVARYTKKLVAYLNSEEIKQAIKSRLQKFR